MTQTASAAAELTLDTTREIRQQFATDIAIERTRLLYQGSWVPTLFMLLNSAACAFLLWAPPSRVLLSGWLIWLVLLAVLRLLQVSAFNRAQPSRQVQAHWRRNFLFGAGASGLTLAFAAIALVPADVFYQQALVYGLIAAVGGLSAAQRTQPAARLGHAWRHPAADPAGGGLAGQPPAAAQPAAAFPESGADRSPGACPAAGRDAQWRTGPRSRAAPLGRRRAAHRPCRAGNARGRAHPGAGRCHPRPEQERGAPGPGPGGQRVGLVGLEPAER